MEPLIGLRLNHNIHTQEPFYRREMKNAFSFSFPMPQHIRYSPIGLLVFHNWKCTAFTHVMNKWHVVRPNSNHSVFIYNGNLIYYYSIFYTEIDNCNW